MPAIPTTETTITQTSINNAASLLKRSSMSNPDKYPLYIFLIIAGCIVGGLIGFSVYTMFYGIDDTNKLKDVSYEQRQYMREARQRNLNALAVQARRPDLIVPMREDSVMLDPKNQSENEWRESALCKL
ncbi:unnamed protein product [Penicillium glandicola]